MLRAGDRGRVERVRRRVVGHLRCAQCRLGRGRRRHQPRGRLANAWQRGRLSEHANQLPRRCWHRGGRRPCGWLAQRIALRGAAPLLDRDRGELPAVAPLHPRRAGDGPRTRRHWRRDSQGEHELHHRPPGPGQPEAVPHQRGRSARDPALQLRGLAHSLDGQHHHSGQDGVYSRGPLPGSLPGRGLARADDRRTERQPRLVPSAAVRRRGEQPAGAAARRQARADVVAGPHPGGRLRAGRRRDLQHLLPALGHDPRRQRLPRRPARSPVDLGRHCLDRRVRPDRDEPLGLPRRGQRRAHRLGCAGDRREDWPRDVGMARARAHLAGRLEQPGAQSQLPVGLRPHQLRRSRQRRGRAALLAQHVDALRRRYPQRRHPLAARRQPLELQARVGDAHLLAARRRMAARRPDLGVRQWL